jgi:hypothetical protein
MVRRYGPALAAVALAMAVASPSLARVGETRLQCEQRYGTLKPGTFNEYSNAMEFTKGDIKGSLVFGGPEADARCVLFQICHADGTALGPEIRAVMDANKGNAEWSAGVKTRTGLGPRWDYTTSDGRLHAFVVEIVPLTNYLTIESCEWRNKLKEAEKQKARDSVRGF